VVGTGTAAWPCNVDGVAQNTESRASSVDPPALSERATLGITRRSVTFSQNEPEIDVAQQLTETPVGEAAQRESVVWRGAWAGAPFSAFVGVA
jgi:hypothetical protein